MTSWPRVLKVQMVQTGTFFAHLDDKTLCGIARHLRELFALLMIYFK